MNHAAKFLLVAWIGVAAFVVNESGDLGSRIYGKTGTVTVARCDTRDDGWTCHGRFQADGGGQIAWASFYVDRLARPAEGSRFRASVADLDEDQATLHDASDAVFRGALWLLAGLSPTVVLAWRWPDRRRGERHGVRGHPGTESN